MDTRWLKEDDYETTLTEWWSDWKFASPLKANLPDNGLGGLMVSNNGINICAGFLYQTNSKTAWIEFVVSNKKYRENNRGQALELLINVLSIKASELGYTHIYTSLTHPVLMKRYEQCGFIAASKGCTEMIKVL